MQSMPQTSAQMCKLNSSSNCFLIAGKWQMCILLGRPRRQLLWSTQQHWKLDVPLVWMELLWAIGLCEFSLELSWPVQPLLEEVHTFHFSKCTSFNMFTLATSMPPNWQLSSLGYVQLPGLLSCLQFKTRKRKTQGEKLLWLLQLSSLEN